MIDVLRQTRNRLQAELSSCKDSGRDYAPIIRQMKEVSAQIKVLENEQDASNGKASKTHPVATENTALDVSPDELFQWRTKSPTTRPSELTFRCLKLGSDEFDDQLEAIKKLEEKAQVFPQNKSQWVVSWADSIGDKDIYLALIEREKIPVAYCWLSLRNIGPLRVLQSAPIHFCDFFDIVSAQDLPTETTAAVMAAGLKTLQCDLIRLRNVNSQSKLRSALEPHNGWMLEGTHQIQTRLLIGNHSPMDRVSKKLQYSIRSKRRKLEQRHGEAALSIIEIKSYDEYMKVEKDFAAIHKNRWGTEIPKDARERRANALRYYLPSKEARIFALYVSGKLAAYKIGFMFKGIFWEWKSCSLTEFNEYSINEIFLHDLTEGLQKEGIAAYNFMAGEYEYKRRWGDPELKTTNSDYLSANSFIGRLALIGARLLTAMRTLRNQQAK